MLYEPKLNFEKPQEGYHTLSLEHMAVVSINTHIKELYPFETYYDDGVEGDMKYYYIVIDEI